LAIDNTGAFGISSVTYNITSLASNGLTASAGSPNTGTGLSATVISDDAWTNKTALPVDVVYTIVPVSDKGCTGTPEDITFTINPEPDLVTPTTTVCSDDVIGVTLTDVHSLADRFEIVSITPTGGITAGAGNATTGANQLSGAIANDTWTNKTANQQTVTYRIIPRVGGGCIGDPENIVVNINPEPDLTTPSPTVCSDAITGVTLADVHTLANRFNIVSISATGGITAGAGNASTGADQLSDAIVNDTWTNKTATTQTVTYSVIPRIAGGCIGDEEDIIVTISPEPDLLTPAPSVCSDEAIGVTLDDVHNLANRFEIVSITPGGGLVAGAGNATTGADQLDNAIYNDIW
ncbi:MAG: hypothetical protein LC650_03575, partial [Actinobacteria bacterium]|nr:hypothetical protein [Actinomycetota bacterium]